MSIQHINHDIYNDDVIEDNGWCTSIIGLDICEDEIAFGAYAPARCWRRGTGGGFHDPAAAKQFGDTMDFKRWMEKWTQPSSLPIWLTRDVETSKLWGQASKVHPESHTTGSFPKTIDLREQAPRLLMSRALGFEPFGMAFWVAWAAGDDATGPESAHLSPPGRLEAPHVPPVQKPWIRGWDAANRRLNEVFCIEFHWLRVKMEL